MAHGKRNFKFDPVRIERKSWRPENSTPEQNAEMQSHAEKVTAAWLQLRALMIEGLNAQSRCQGNKATGTISAIASTHNGVKSFVEWLAVKPPPGFPTLPPLC